MTLKPIKPLHSIFPTLKHLDMYIYTYIDKLHNNTRNWYH